MVLERLAGYGAGQPIEPIRRSLRRAGETGATAIDAAGRTMESTGRSVWNSALQLRSPPGEWAGQIWAVSRRTAIGVKHSAETRPFIVLCTGIIAGYLAARLLHDRR
jgi:hypothetical protein